MILSVQPIEFTNVNSYTVAERLDLVQGNGGTYYVQLIRYEEGVIPPSGPGLYAQSALKKTAVRYIPAAGATVQLVFPRSLSIAATPSNQDVTATCTLNADDRSICSFTLTVPNVDKIVSEGAKLVITENSVVKTYAVDHLVRRRSNAPGA